MKIDLSNTELELVIDALTHRASRHESEAKYNPRNAKPHDQKAAAMHQLKRRLAALVTVAAMFVMMLAAAVPSVAFANQQLACVVVNNCQTCSRSDSFGTHTYQCNCRAECLPGTGAIEHNTKVARMCRTICSQRAPGSGMQECNTFCD